MYDVVVHEFTFGISSPDEFLSVFDSVLIPMHVVVEITITLNG